MKGEMPFKMHNFFYFFSEKVSLKKWVPTSTLSKILRLVTRNTLIFFIWPEVKE